MRLADEDLRNCPPPPGSRHHLVAQGVVPVDLDLTERHPLAGEKGLGAGAVAAPAPGIDHDVRHGASCMCLAIPAPLCARQSATVASTFDLPPGETFRTRGPVGCPGPPEPTSRM